MGGTGAAFGGGQGATAAALTLGLIQDVVHGGEHVPGWDAVHGECCGFVIGDKFPWGKWLSPQRVLAKMDTDARMVLAQTSAVVSNLFCATPVRR